MTSPLSHFVEAAAPGRVNLIGEHTDYNGGFVLPLALPLVTKTVGKARSDNQVLLKSFEQSPEKSDGHYRLGEEKPTGTWVDYIQGLTWAMAEKGYSLGGFEAKITSTVPLGSGLSSSAALEVSVLRMLRKLFGLHLNDVDLAHLAHRCESEFVGARVGMMDQMAASLGDSRHALFLNTQTGTYKPIPFPPEASLIVMNSGITHQHASGPYNTRRQECAQAAQMLGITNLSQLTTQDLKKIQSLPSPLNRRAHHVITENQRVLEAMKAMEKGDLEELGRLFYASHDSMRDDYEVSIPEIDFLIELCRAEKNIYGARMTGGGFGGCIIILTTPRKGKSSAQHVADLYAKRFKREADLLLEMIFKP